MGATKTVGDEVVRWISNGEPIDPEHSAWKTDPRKDQGQFYAQNNNVSCLLANLHNVASFHGWGIKDCPWSYDNCPLAKTLCERQIK